MGIWFFVTIAAGLSSFGVQKNPAAPSPAEVMKYAPPDSDLMVHVDLKAVVPENYRALLDLPRDPIAAELEIAPNIETAMRQAEGARSMVQGTTGLDFIKDPTSATAWFKFADAGRPEMLFVVRGTFPKDAIEKIAGLSGAAIDIAGAKGMQPEPGIVIAQTDSGEIIGGTRALVEPRLAASFKARAVKNAALSAVLAKKPFALVVSTPSKAAIRLYSRATGGENLMVDALAGHRFAAVALLHHGVHWTFQARDKGGYERGLEASEAVTQLMRASQLGARGAARLLMAALPSYSSRPWAQKLLAHKKEFQEIVDAYLGDKEPRVQVARKAGRNEVAVTMTGSAFSHVMPMVLLGAAGAFGWYTQRASEAGPQAPASGPEPEGRTAAIAAPTGPSSLSLRRAWDMAASRRAAR